MLGALVLAAWPRQTRAEWTAATPDETISRARAATTATGVDAAGRMLLVASLADRAAAGAADRALAAIEARGGALGGEARWLRRRMSAPAAPPTEDEGAPAADSVDDDRGGPAGLLRTWAILGPFEDSGEGLARREGPEEKGFRWSRADVSRGAITVRPVRTRTASVEARGVPLDRYVSPRAESCTYAAVRIDAPAPAPVVVWVASSGSVRAHWDGVEIVRDERVHERAWLDRAAARLEATAGPHRLQLKVCSGSLGDEGRFRVRLSRPDGTDLRWPTTSELSGLDAVARQGAIATAMPTALSAALAPPAAEESQRLLAAAVAAALGGADDRRATRVPGWLDSLAAQASPDTLAIAGYVAPFHAPRTGWLERAWRRGRGEGADGAASFAQRALVAARLEAGAADLAERALAEPPLSEATDPDAEVLRARAQGARGGMGYEARGRRDLFDLIQARGSTAPTAAWRGVEELGGLPRVRWGVQRELVRRHHVDWSAWVGLARVGGDAQLVRAATWALPRVGSAHDANLIAAGLLRHGHAELARATYADTAARTPNDVDAWSGWAEAAAAAGAPATEIVAALERALALEPSPALEAQLAFRRGAPVAADGPDLGEDARWIEAPATFLARAVERRRNTPSPGVRSRQLHWRRVVRYHPDQRVSQLMHWAREVVVEPRDEEERYEELPVGELLLARVHKRNGTVVAPEERDDGVPTVRWPHLKRGDVVEIAVRSWTPGPVGRRGDPPFSFVDYVGSVETEPVLHNEVVIDVPDGAPLVFDVLAGEPSVRREERVGDRTVTTLVWDAPPTVRDEPLAPPLTESLPLVVGSIYAGWGQLDGWYRSATRGFTEPDAQIERLARELTARAPTREQKVRALFEFVADDIRYVNYRSGEWWLPNRPQDLLARRQGDCDDKAMLLVSLLAAVGIEAEEVLIQTRMTPSPTALASERVAIPMFDHGIVFLPGEAGGYLDPTTPQTRIGALPAMDAGAPVLRVGHPTIARTPVGSPADHGVDGTWAVVLDAHGGAALKATEIHAGDAAFELRVQLSEPDARGAWLEQHLQTGWFSGVAPGGIDFAGDEAGGAAELRYDARLAHFARREGASWVVPVGDDASLANALAPLPRRTQPVVLPPAVSPRHHWRETTFVAPPGFVFAPPPPDGRAEAPGHGRAELRFERSADGRRVVVSHRFELSSIEVPVSDYPAWRTFLRAADGLRRRALRLVEAAP